MTACMHAWHVHTIPKISYFQLLCKNFGPTKNHLTWGAAELWHPRSPRLMVPMTNWMKHGPRVKLMDSPRTSFLPINFNSGYSGWPWVHFWTGILFVPAQVLPRSRGQDPYGDLWADSWDWGLGTCHIMCIFILERSQPFLIPKVESRCSSRVENQDSAHGSIRGFLLLLLSGSCLQQGLLYIRMLYIELKFINGLFC